MKEHYHWTLDEYDSIAPYERDIIVQMIKENEEKKKQEQAELQARSK